MAGSGSFSGSTDENMSPEDKMMQDALHRVLIASVLTTLRRIGESPGPEKPPEENDNKNSESSASPQESSSRERERIREKPKDGSRGQLWIHATTSFSLLF